MQVWTGWRYWTLPRWLSGRGFSIRSLFIAATAVLVCVLLLTAWMLWDAKRDAWSHAIRSAENVAGVVEHSIKRNLDIYDLELQAVIDGLQLPEVSRLNPKLRDLVLFDRAATARFFGAITVLDENGRVLLESQGQPAADQHYADREFFQFHREHVDAALHIGTPFSDATGRSWVPLSRRIDRRDGTFAGVVFGTLDLQFFAQLFALGDVGPSGSVSLFRSDGTLIYGTPEAGDLFERSTRQARRYAPTEPTFTISPEDGTEHRYTFHPLGDLPLVLVVGISREAVLADWRQKAVVTTIAVFGLSVVVALLGIALLGELRRRGRAEQEAQESREHYRHLAENSFDMIVRFDPTTGRHTYVSPACRRLYGYDPAQLMAMNWAEIIHQDDLDGLRQVLSRLGRGEQTPVTYRGRRRDGAYIWVEASLTPSRRADSGKTEIISIVRDVSDRVRYEAELHRAKDQADAANRAKSEFLATMSHELRTPLNAIIGFAEIMHTEVMGPVANEHYRSYIADIHMSGTHLLELINEILDLTKAETGKLELQEEVFDLADAVRSISRLCKPRIEKAQLRSTMSVPPDLPMLRADPRKTRQVLFNLIGNAVKFTPPGGRIDVSAHYDPRVGVMVTVADTGIGIAPQDLSRVTERFVQVDSSLSRNHEGSGLGLPVVKAIMELHGGSLKLKSALGEWTEATVVFPAYRAVLEYGYELAQSA